MKITKTERRFKVATFIDEYGQECSIQDSSLATKDCIWLGVDKDIDGKEVNKRMHMDKELVTQLMPHLIAFLSKGSIDDA